MKSKFCKNGHKRTPDNITKRKACKICRAENQRKRRELNRA